MEVDMTASRALALGATVLAVAAILVGLTLAARALRASTGPAAPRPAVSAPADGSTSTRLPSPDTGYWTPERMRSAGPAPMPKE
jgi:hypothetical protein